MVANKTVQVTQEGWLEFDITEPAEHWNIYRTSNMGLFMRVLDTDGKQTVINNIIYQVNNACNYLKANWIYPYGLEFEVGDYIFVP